MKKCIPFLVLLFFVNSIFANPVSEKSAEQVALNFYSFKAKTEINSLKISSVETYKYKNLISFYIYNIKNGGFVIVSADDAAKPILGYSTENKLGNYKKNSEISYWLQNYAEEIKSIVDKKLNNNVTIAEWQKILNYQFLKNGKAVSPLLTTTWDQTGYYNDLCPSNTPTGCVATSTAQVMKYHNWPTTGAFRHSYVHPTYGLQSANFKNTTYNWTNMPNSVTSANNDVATLMYHVGVAVDMNYASAGSGSQTTYLLYVLSNYFKYGQDIASADKNYYTDTEWKNLLKSELDASRPMVYSGSSTSSGGHAWVCDGYDDSDNFHMNWGWGSYADGYFAIGNLNPAGENFNDDNKVIYNIHPAATPEFKAVSEYSGLSDVAAQQSAYIGYIQSPNANVAWGTARDGSGSSADYRIYTKSIDGGLSWQAKEISNLGGTSFSMIYGLDADNAYIAMWGDNQSNNKILRTTDGGDNWEVVLSGGHSGSFFNVVHFFDENNGFVQGDPDTDFELYTTIDGGDIWTRVPGADIPDPLSGEFGITGMYTAVGNVIWFSTNKGRVFKSTDKGLNWTVVNIMTPSAGNSTYIDLAFNDNQNGLALVTVTDGTNFSYEYYSTTDGGTNWTQINNPTGNFYNSDISAVPGVDNVFYSVGADYQTPKMGISYTTDGGQTWTELSDYYKNFQFTTVAMASADKGFFGTFAGTYQNGAWVFGDAEPLIPAFGADNLKACINTDVIFTSTSTGDITDYTWDFGADANPATAVGEGPHTVQYTSGGLKTVSLTISDGTNSFTETKTDYVKVSEAQPANIDTIYGSQFVIAGTTNEYSIDEQSDYPDYYWSNSNSLFSFLGETNNYTIQLQTSTFANQSTNLSVYVENGCGVSNTKQITVTTQESSVNEIDNGILLSSNVVKDFLNISSKNPITNVSVVNISGKTVVNKKYNDNGISLNLSNLSSGVYFVKINTEKQTIVRKIIVE